MTMELEQLHLGGFLDFKTRADAIRPEVGRNESRIPVRVKPGYCELTFATKKDHDDESGYAFRCSGTASAPGHGPGRHNQRTFA